MRDEIRKIKELTAKFKWVLVLVFILVAAAGIYRIVSVDWTKRMADRANSFVNDVIIGTEGKVTTITKTSLQEIFEISELSTASYTYNAIATLYAEGETAVKYHVAYNGTVAAGIDFSKIDIKIDENTKKITVELPACEILETTVDFGSMEYIFIDKKSESETVSQEAYHACKADLEMRAAKDGRLITMAEKNAASAIEALVSPWMKQAYSDYEVVIQ